MRRTICCCAAVCNDAATILLNGIVPSLESITQKILAESILHHKLDITGWVNTRHDPVSAKLDADFTHCSLPRRVHIQKSLEAALVLVLA